MSNTSKVKSRALQHRSSNLYMGCQGMITHAHRAQDYNNPRLAQRATFYTHTCKVISLCGPNKLEKRCVGRERVSRDPSSPCGRNSVKTSVLWSSTLTLEPAKKELRDLVREARREDIDVAVQAVSRMPCWYRQGCCWHALIHCNDNWSRFKGFASNPK